METLRVSLVTGASSGIGAAAAEALARSGSQLAVHFNRSADQAASVVDRISRSGGCAHAFQADLSDPDQPNALVDAVLQKFGRLDVLVNNAGSLIGRRSLMDITDDFWRDVMETNLGSVMRMTRAAAAHMISRGSGAMVNVGSVAARSGGSAGVMAYAAAKAAVVGMTKALAKELIPHGIRVNAVNPGVISTPLHDRFTPAAQMNALISAIPQRRAGTPEEVASVIVFLAGDGASYITGETIEVNGGLWMD
jgi:3-oxoacyl-[acyl-carrier protein] reductase